MITAVARCIKHGNETWRNRADIASDQKLQIYRTPQLQTLNIKLQTIEVSGLCNRAQEKSVYGKRKVSGRESTIQWCTPMSLRGHDKQNARRTIRATQNRLC